MNEINYNKNSDFESAELSISSKNLKCERVANYLKKAGIMSSITSNQSIICDNENHCYFENGCRIKLNVCNKPILKDQIWEPIKKQENLTCAHLKIPGIFSGCIYDYIRDTSCPNNK